MLGLFFCINKLILALIKYSTENFKYSFRDKLCTTVTLTVLSKILQN